MTEVCPGCGALHRSSQPELGPPKLQVCEACGHLWHPLISTTGKGRKR